MNNSTKKKSEKLGMNFSTARNHLHKSILFSLLKIHGYNICYRCKKEIDNINELSVEHKKAWLNSENPKKLFFDLNNIAFSHFKCNVACTEMTLEGRNKISKANSGENSSNHKLSNNDIDEILILLNQNMSLRKIAKRFNVVHGTIAKVRDRKRIQSIKIKK